MTITVIGLGLIGGSLCKAIKAKTAHTCYGVNRNPAVLDVALKDGAIDRGFALEERLPASDVYVVCFHPRMTIDYIARRAGEFAPGSLVIDVCGVKSAVVEEAERALLPQGVRFLGTHPMAGREFSGYDYSLPTLYDGASIVLTPTAQSRPEDIELMKGLAAELGFGRIVATTPEEHDRIIAFTSQMAHVVANAYVKTPMLERHGGFTGGSFQDMTRVARLNADMWTELFLMNRGPLLEEVDNIIRHLTEYRDALADGDEKRLRGLLQDGSDRKIRSLEPGDN
ncbi:MAG: prephenate dehydrogenase [Oscillospiraceae bacterium]|jgi:prephenate dehydrogenase|nr:prephenate dehydrogenase [Oscillospiraceae bacterium]